MSAAAATDAGAGPGAGAGSVPAVSTTCLGIQRVVVPSLARLPTFCHATVHNGLVHVAGTLGTTGATLAAIRLEEGVSAQTFKALENIETILLHCGSSVEHLLKVNVFLADFSPAKAAEMNAGYARFFGDRPVPARITVGTTKLAFGAAVEIDAVAAVAKAGMAGSGELAS